MRLLILGLLFFAGCSMSVLPKSDAPSALPCAAPTVDPTIEAAKKIDVTADRAPACPAPYEMCLDHDNAVKLRTKLRLLTEQGD